jgi:hypothetical protein
MKTVRETLRAMEKDSFAASITPLSATNESVAGIAPADTRKTAYLAFF